MNSNSQEGAAPERIVSPCCGALPSCVLEREVPYLPHHRVSVSPPAPLTGDGRVCHILPHYHRRLEGDLSPPASVTVRANVCQSELVCVCVCQSDLQQDH